MCVFLGLPKNLNFLVYLKVILIIIKVINQIYLYTIGYIIINGDKK